MGKSQLTSTCWNNCAKLWDQCPWNHVMAHLSPPRSVLDAAQVTGRSGYARETTTSFMYFGHPPPCHSSTEGKDLISVDEIHALFQHSCCPWIVFSSVLDEQLVTCSSNVSFILDSVTIQPMICIATCTAKSRAVVSNLPGRIYRCQLCPIFTCWICNCCRTINCHLTHPFSSTKPTCNSWFSLWNFQNLISQIHHFHCQQSRFSCSQSWPSAHQALCCSIRECLSVCFGSMSCNRTFKGHSWC